MPEDVALPFFAHVYAKSPIPGLPSGCPRAIREERARRLIGGGVCRRARAADTEGREREMNEKDSREPLCACVRRAERPSRAREKERETAEEPSTCFPTCLHRRETEGS